MIFAHPWAYFYAEYGRRVLGALIAEEQSIAAGRDPATPPAGWDPDITEGVFPVHARYGIPIPIWPEDEPDPPAELTVSAVVTPTFAARTRIRFRIAPGWQVPVRILVWRLDLEDGEVQESAEHSTHILTSADPETDWITPDWPESPPDPEADPAEPDVETRLGFLFLPGILSRWENHNDYPREPA